MNHPIASKVAAVLTAVMMNGVLLSGVSYVFAMQAPQRVAEASNVQAPESAPVAIV
jgi:hypothetical protein